MNVTNDFVVDFFTSQNYVTFIDPSSYDWILIVPSAVQSCTDVLYSGTDSQLG